jgi:hypothetical protein
MPRMIFPAALMPAALFVAGLLFVPALGAQTTPFITYNSIRTPEIQLGSGTAPTTITAPPVIEISSLPSEPQVSNASPADTELLAGRHFDFIVSPIAEFPWTRGNMADTSISLGEYARQLRAQKPSATNQAFPNAIAQPADSR